MDNEYQWVSDFKVKIASYLKMKIPQSHPKTYVTDKSKDLSDPTFPTVYFHAMQRQDKTLKHVLLMESQHHTRWM